MPIVVTCPCGQSSEAPDSAMGMGLSCPACGQDVLVPIPAVGPIVACQCGQRFRADPRLIGSVVACPVCRRSIAVPHPATQSIFDELPVGPIPVRAPAPARPIVMPVARAAHRGVPNIGAMSLLRVSGGALLLSFVALQTVWVCYNLFVEQLTDKLWLLPIHVPFLVGLLKLGLYLVWPRADSPDAARRGNV
jgi:rRNA maturation protein Nop10